MNQVPDMLWRTDRHGLCEYVTEEWAAFVGRSPESQLADGWISTIHPDDRDGVIALVRREMAAQRRFLTRFRVLAAGGRWETVRSAGRPHWHGGELQGYIGAVYPFRAECRSPSGALAPLPIARHDNALRPYTIDQADEGRLPRSMTESL